MATNTECPNIVKGLLCSSCNCIVHRKCSEIPLKELNTIDSTFMKHFECLSCLKEKYPLFDLTTENIIKESFNSNFNCACQTTTRKSIINNKHKFNFANFTEEYELKGHGPDANNHIDTIFDLKPKFDYFTNHDFHKLGQGKISASKPLSILHTNISSIQHNLDNLTYLLENLQYKFDVIAFSETWNPDSKAYKFNAGIIEGYQPYTGTNSTSIKGGCGFFIRTSINYINRKDLDIKFCDDHNEYQSKWGD